MRTPSGLREREISMDKMRILPGALLCGFLSTPALAQLTTIGPNTRGVTESEMTLVPMSTPYFYAPKFTPMPLGSLPGGFDSFVPALSEVDPHGCLEGCSAAGIGGDPQEFVLFDVTFSKPVSVVSVLQMGYGLDMGNGAELLAYNSSLQNVGSCNEVFGLGPSPGSPPSCFTATSSSGGGSTELGNLTVSTPTPDITTVLIAGNEGAPAFGTAVQFSATPVATPEPGTFVPFALALAGIGMTRKRRTSPSPASIQVLDAETDPT